MFTFRPVFAAAFLALATGCAVEQASEEPAQNEEASESAEKKKAEEDKKIEIELNGAEPAKKREVYKK